jgi:hypothetical protein
MVQSLPNSSRATQERLVQKRADAFRGREFAGKVVSIAPLVQPARINSPGSRNLSDFSVTDVLIELSDPGPLLVGMKVDRRNNAPRHSTNLAMEAREGSC